MPFAESGSLGLHQPFVEEDVADAFHHCERRKTGSGLSALCVLWLDGVESRPQREQEDY